VGNGFEAATATRRRALDMAATGRLRVAGAHTRLPTLSHVAGDGASTRFGRRSGWSYWSLTRQGQTVGPDHGPSLSSTVDSYRGQARSSLTLSTGRLRPSAFLIGLPVLGGAFVWPGSGHRAVAGVAYGPACSRSDLSRLPAKERSG
jgi:hypothetical protein